MFMCCNYRLIGQSCSISFNIVNITCITNITLFIHDFYDILFALKVLVKPRMYFSYGILRSNADKITLHNQTLENFVLKFNRLKIKFT